MLNNRPGLHPVADTAEQANERCPDQSIENTLLIVSRAWDRILGEHSSTLELTWDEAGGNSLQFLRLIFEVEETLGLTMPPGSFTIDMQPGDLAAAIDGLGANAAPLASDDASVQLFLFPGVGGDEPLLSALRDELRQQLTIVTLQYPGWTTISDPRFGFLDMVTEMVDQIVQAAPEGPLCLAGYSYGGIVAFAAARQLRMAGRTVALLGVLDANISARPLPRASGFPGLMVRAAKLPRFLARENRFDNLCRITATYLLSPRLRGLSLRLLDPRRGWVSQDIRFWVNYWLCRIRRIETAQGWLISLADTDDSIKTILFRSEERAATDAADLGWRRYIPSLTIITVHGDHFSMLAARNESNLASKLLEQVRLHHAAAVQHVG